MMAVLSAFVHRWITPQNFRIFAQLFLMLQRIKGFKIWHILYISKSKEIIFFGWSISKHLFHFEVFIFSRVYKS